jgi:hypothetical protein
MVEFPTLLLRAWTERISDGVASMAELCTGLPMHTCYTFRRGIYIW